jgi:hypothetical protein
MSRSRLGLGPQRLVYIPEKWITETTLELAQKKREARLRVKDSEKKAAEYKKLCNEVKASARKDKQDWLEKQCNDIEKYSEERKTRKAYRLVKSISRKWEPRQMAVKDKTGNTLMDREQCLQRWTQYCSEESKEKKKPRI